MFQHRIWQELAPGDGPGRLANVVEQLRQDDSRFHVEGGSWTNDLSWVRGYDQVLAPMEQASALFYERMLTRGVPANRTRGTARPCFTCSLPRPAATATGAKGVWTDYGAELSRRTADIVTHPET